ncbi:CDP-alcohol phosphatidyltransferase family protein [Coccidioides posadasii C735 delta SOWgp]|uniref:Cardiolipin synthetase n=2 Tax=Coccidioides posadasii TaxID=199306 RepID=A0A0J6F170_COCPO|nr:CDP-alcohol phosphatidyltransferase family protein [Coccidioides posadasii C735 delta SOWgp]EER28984.1 CDP-alcohol phosphatidyltransferase family protein [Coccidioides posadasii C735 delta SOWgp]KMM63828.1 cardiolipin synthetase [Coccidioides posadasii RMSCC 3488]|eukprot:XP_003071129.1 CDP-alcohol phosphatidyltransferase family protein [Coccidioides posadasii C735 delta SOWgp]
MRGTVHLRVSLRALRAGRSSLPPQQRSLTVSYFLPFHCRRQLLFSSFADSGRVSLCAKALKTTTWGCGDSMSGSVSGFRSGTGLGCRGLLHWRRSMSSERPSEKKNDDTQKASDSKPSLASRLPIPGREDIYTIPNILTFTRLVAAPMVGYFILNSNHVMALSLFAYASITDLVDGYIARRFGQQTVVGTIIDPMADKILMTVGVICLAIKSAIPVWLAGVILARDVGLAISAIYYRWISLPPPKTMARYWDFSLPSAEVKPTRISKVNTALQLLLIGGAMAMPVIPEAILSAWNLHEGMIGLQYIVALTTCWSGLGYIYSKDAVRILSRDKSR